MIYMKTEKKGQFETIFFFFDAVAFELAGAG